MPISALKILLLVKRFIQISVDVNKPFAIKCCVMTQTEALLYIYWLLITNTLFVEQILPKSTSLPEYLATFSPCGGDFRKRKDQLSRICRYRMNLGQTPLYDETQGIYKQAWKWAKNAERRTQHVNEFFTNLPPKTWMSM